MTPLVINRATNPVDLPKKANLCHWNKEHKQELESMQLNESDNCRCMIKIMKVGFHNQRRWLSEDRLI
jgi:hypothetical protein